MARNPYDNLATLGTISKLGTTLSRKIVLAYLKTAGYLRFKAWRKLYLTRKHKETRLRWAREHLGWTLGDCKRVLWTDEATFEIGLDSRRCYIPRKPSMAMKSQYLKLTFKNRRTTLRIWGVITLGKKGPVHFLIKEGCMISQIYLDQVLEQLSLPFYIELKEERRFMIWMYDGASYYTSKFITKFCCQACLLCMNWPPQSPDLNLIENL